MPFDIVNSKNSSDASEEYVVLRATGDTNNLSGYAIVDNTYNSSGDQSNTYRHIFIFPSFAVEKNEYVVLWTGHGNQKTITDSDGDIVHHFYWNSDECVWNDDGDVAHLIKFERKDKRTIPPVD